MAVLTPSRPTVRRTTPVTRRPTPNATAQIRARTGVLTCFPDPRGTTHPSGAPAEATPAPREDAGAPATPLAARALVTPAEPDASVPAAPAHPPAASAAGQFGAGETPVPPDACRSQSGAV